MAAGICDANSSQAGGKVIDSDLDAEREWFLMQTPGIFQLNSLIRIPLVQSRLHNCLLSWLCKKCMKTTVTSAENNKNIQRGKFSKFKFNSVARVVIVNFLSTIPRWAGCSTTDAFDFASCAWVLRSAMLIWTNSTLLVGHPYHPRIYTTNGSSVDHQFSIIKCWYLL